MPDQVKQPDGSVIDPTRTKNEQQTDLVQHPTVVPQPRTLEGLLSARPAASSVPAKTMYFATDDNGGTMYRSDGTAWLKISPGVTEATAATEIAYVENVTGTVTAVSSTGGGGAYVDIPGCSIVVPAQTRPVWLRAKYGYAVTTAAAAAVAYAVITETTGAVTQLEQSGTTMPNSTTTFAGVGEAKTEYRIGPTAVQRTFKLQARVGTPAATTAALNVSNLGISPSFIVAETR